MLSRVVDEVLALEGVPLLRMVAWVMIIAGALAFSALQFMPAPYGKYAVGARGYVFASSRRAVTVTLRVSMSCTVPCRSGCVCGFLVRVCACVCVCVVWVSVCVVWLPGCL
jgi:hypothetical protein